ncbi:MAG: clostripain-related cysteine peptidase [Candidatus Xenobia bacterium]
MRPLTVLVFMNGNNDIEPEVVRNLIELESVGSSPDVNVVAQLSRAPQSVVHPYTPYDQLDGDWSGVRRYYVKQAPNPDADRTMITSPVVQQLPSDTDMGSQKTLTDFLKWGVANYPAQKYVVIIDDHGAGFVGCSFDDLHHSNLSPMQVQGALHDAGIKPAILDFDCCEMQQAEVAYQLRNSAQVMVGSEEMIGSDGQAYAPLLQCLTAHPQESASPLAARMVAVSAGVEAARKLAKTPVVVQQLSALDLSKMTAVRDAVDALGKSLQADVPRDTIIGVLTHTRRFSAGGHQAPDKDYRDLGDFATQLLGSSAITSERVREAAQQVLSVLDGAIIAQHRQGVFMGPTHGLSIYLPFNALGGDPVQPYVKNDDPDNAGTRFGYGDLAFANDCGWAHFLDWLTTPARQEAMAEQA